MMTLEQIALLVRQTELRGVASFEYEEDGCVLRLATAEASEARAGYPVNTTQAPFYICAPAAGVFHASHPLHAQSTASKGTHTREGQIVGFLQVGPVLRPVLAGEGVVDACVAEDGEMVGFGAALFRLGRNGA